MKRPGLEIQSNNAAKLGTMETMKIESVRVSIGPDLTRSVPMDLKKITGRLIIDYFTLLT